MRNRVAVHARRQPRRARPPAGRALRRAHLRRLEHRIEGFARELGLEARFFQTNHEGEYVEELHKAPDYAEACSSTPARGRTTRGRSATRSSSAGLPAVEVHLSDVKHREPFRAVSVLEDVCVARSAGRASTATARRSSALKAACEPRRPRRRAAGRARARPPARDRHGQPALPHRLHRQQRPGDRRDRHAPLPHGLPLCRARRGGGRGVRLEPRGAGAAHRARAGLARGPLRLGFEDEHVSVRRHAELRETLPDRIELVPAAASSRPSARSRSPPRSRRSAPPPSSPTRATPAARARADRAGPSARWRPGSSRRCASRRGGPASRRSSPRRRTARCRTRRRGTSRSRRARWSRSTSARASTATARTARAHGRPARRRRLAEAYDTCSGAGRRARRGPAGPEGREVDAVARDLIAAAGHGEYFGHCLGPRRRAGHPRGAAAGADRRSAARGGERRHGRARIYVPGRGGARIEDLVVVTDGGRDVLSATPKALTTVG